MTITQAMVLAAGLGTRMRPITDTMPKPLVPVAGKPLIDHALDVLADAGVLRAAVNVHHFADRMEAHLAAYPRIAISVSDERAGLLDSGGGLVKALPLLDPGLLYVMNADLFWIGEKADETSNLTLLADYFDAGTMDMALLCVPLERTSGHNGKRDFQLDADGRLRRWTQNGSDDGDNPVVYAGAIVLDSALFDDAPEGKFSLNRYFDRAIERGRLFGLKLHGHWITVGTPEALPEAEAVIAAYRHRA